MKNKSLFCSYAWKEVSFLLAQNSIKYCCKSEEISLPDEITPEFINNNERITNRRKDLLQNVKNPDCNKCWKDELQSGTSYRILNSNPQEYKKIVAEPYGQHITVVEIQFDNICNQSCIYCSPDYSSIIARERGIKDRFLTYDNKKLQQIIDWLEDLYKKDSSPKVIRIVGGEPTISKNWYNFLDMILQSSLINYELYIRTITNCNFTKSTKYKIDQYIDNFPKKWHCIFTVSNESTGKISENVRFGSNWDQWAENFKYFIEKDKIELLAICPSPNIFTIKELPNFIHFIFSTIEKTNNKQKFEFHSNWVNSPSILAIDYLPKSFTSYIDDTIEIVTNSNLNFNKDITLKFLNQMKRKIGTKDINQEILKEWLTKENKFKNNQLDIDLLMQQVSI